MPVTCMVTSLVAADSVDRSFQAAFLFGSLGKVPTIRAASRARSLARIEGR
jgi:hypothetical protein